MKVHNNLYTCNIFLFSEYTGEFLTLDFIKDLTFYQDTFGALNMLCLQVQ